MKVAWLCLVVIVLSLAGAACGGGGEKSASGLSDDDLKEIVSVTSDGLPWQVVENTDTALSNEEAAQRNSDPEQWQKDYEEWGRTGGHYASYVALAGQGISIQANVAAYESVDGAGKAYTTTTDFFVSDEALQQMEKAGITDGKIEELSTETIGDESRAFRIAGTDSQGQAGETFVVTWRHADLLLTASVGAKAVGDASVEDAVAVANQVDGHAKDVLGY